jgi:hypothetical protein
MDKEVYFSQSDPPEGIVSKTFLTARQASKFSTNYYFSTHPLLAGTTIDMSLNYCFSIT